MTSNDNSGRQSNLTGRQLGDYKLLELLASGGMANVYKAEDVKLGRQAAVKILAREMLETDESLGERFQREAKAVAALEHDNIITIYQYGEQEGMYFLVMRLIQGDDLAEELNNLRRQGKLMSPKRLLDILGQIASALDYAHSQGIIHRDVKPSNILLDKNGKAYLTDFGLVLRQKVDKTMGTAFGTPRYISPEQALASDRAVPQSDVYSLAVIVYEALTGQMLFKADTAMQLAMSHVTEPPPPPRTVNPSIPRAVERELLKALDKKPEKRHKTTLLLIQALREAYGPLLDDEPQNVAEVRLSVTPVMGAPPEMKRAQATQKVTTESAPTFIATSEDMRAVRTGKTRLWAGLAGVLAALTIIGGAALLNGRDGAQPSATNAPVATANIQAANTPGSSIPLDYPVMAYYLFDAFALRNEGTTDLNISDLVFIRPDGSDLFSGGGHIPGNVLRPGECLIIRVQGRPVTIPQTWQCGANSTEMILDAQALFWRSDDSATFDMRMRDETMATCAAVNRAEETTCARRE